MAEDIYHVPLQRQVGRHLGIKLGGKRTEPGVFIVELMPQSIAEEDERLRPHDRILCINGQDVRLARPEFASKLIHQSQDVVNLTVCRTAASISSSTSTRGRLDSLSQDSLYGSEDNDHSSGMSASSSASDRASECSAMEEEQLNFVDNISDQCSNSSRASPSSNMSSKDGSLKENIPVAKISSSFPENQYKVHESTKSTQDKQSRWPFASYTLSHNSKKMVINEGFCQKFGRFNDGKEIPLRQKQVILVKVSL